MTRLELRNIVRKRLGETTSAFWTDIEINAYINLACSDIAWRIKCLRSNGTITLASCVANTVAAATTEFTISTYLSDLYAVNEVYFKRENKQFVRLDSTTREELDITDTTWMSSVGRTYTNTDTGVTTYNYESIPGEPNRYYWSREEDVIGVHPPPNDDHDGAPIKIYYSKKHVDLAADSASPQLPLGIHLAIVDFAVASGLEDRGWGDRANDMWNKYQMKLKDYRTEKKNEREDDDLIMKPYRNI